MKLFYFILSALLFTANAQETGSTGPAPTTGPATSPSTATDAAVTTQTPPPPPPPTTGAPTTGPPTPGSSTAPPDAPTTTSPSPPTPPAPTPYVQNGSLATYNFNIADSEGNYCIMISLAMKFNLTYRTMDETLSYAVFDLGNATASGVCNASNSEQIAHLVWGDNQEFNLTLDFQKYTDDSDYGLNHMVFSYNLTNQEMFPNSNDTVKPRYVKTNRLDEETSSDYRIDLGGSYLCDNSFPLHFYYESIDGKTYNESKPTLLATNIQNFKYQAFTDKGVKTYGTYTECSSDFGTSDIVPIAVGCALAALVVIVLIAYLIGRRRSRQKGYQSV